MHGYSAAVAAIQYSSRAAPRGVQIKFRRRRGEFTHPRRARQALRPYLCLSLAAILAAEEEEVHSYYTAHKVSVRPAAIYRRSNNHHRPEKPPRFSHQVWKICCNARFRHTHRLSPLCACVCHDEVNLTHNRTGATGAFFPSSPFYVNSAKYDNKNNSIQVSSPEVKRGSGHVQIFRIVGCMSMMPNSCSALFKTLSCTEIW